MPAMQATLQVSVVVIVDGAVVCAAAAAEAACILCMLSQQERKKERKTPTVHAEKIHRSEAQKVAADMQRPCIVSLL